MSKTNSFSVNAQYIKDFSLENPDAPMSLLQQKNAPSIKIAVDVGVKKFSETECEVALHLSADASHEDKKLFVAELIYAGLFTIMTEGKEEWDYITMVLCPGLLFPFARRILSDTTRDAGFAPLMLDPINFNALYARHQQQQATAQ